MGRRPITPSIEGINLFRQQRMAPGGRRWSESPIPDPAYRRPRARGAEASFPPPPYVQGPEYAEAGNNALGGSTWDIVYSGSGQWWQPGDLAVTTLSQFGASTSLELPAGYVEILSGSFGNVHYKCGWRVTPGSPDWEASATPLYSHSPIDYTGYAAASTVYFEDNGARPSAVVAASGNGVTHTVGGVASNGHNSVLAAADDATNWVVYANGRPSYSFVQSDPVAHWYGRASDYDTPAVESGLITWNRVVDHVELSWSWS